MWKCEHCGTQIEEDNFDACWKCLTPRSVQSPESEPEPAESLEPQRQPGYLVAAGILRFFAWLGIIIGIVSPIVFTFQIFKIAPPSQFADAFKLLGYGFVIRCVVLVFTSLPLFWISSAIRQHKAWGQVAGVIVGVFSLFSFPIGTVFGGLIIYFLIKGWGQNTVGDKTEK